MEATDIEEFKSHTVKIDISRQELSRLKSLCVELNGNDILNTLIKRSTSAFFRDMKGKSAE